MPTRVMLDLETMSTAPNAAIVQIGAVKFTLDGTILSEFKCGVTLESSVGVGLHMDPSTVMWWLRQSDAARKSVCETSSTLRDALDALRLWLGNGPYELWAYPASFDLTILASAYAAIGEKEPWSYRAVRCQRTLAALTDVPRVSPVLAHDALSDATAQAQWCAAQLRALGVKE